MTTHGTPYEIRVSHSSARRPGLTLIELLFVIEVDETRAVHWMAPQDADEAMFLALEAKSNPTHSGGFHAGFADGAARFLSEETPAAERRALLTIAGGESSE